MTVPDRRPRVLYLTAGFPFPLSSGYLRHFHLLRHLAADHRIHLLSLVGPRFDPADLAGLSGFVDQISTFGRPTHHGRAHRLARLLDPGRTDAASQGMAWTVDDEITRHGVDVVVLSGKETVAAAEAVAGRVPLVVDLCDATSSRVSQEIHLAGAVRRAGLLVRRRSVRRVERRLVQLADGLLTASERDRVALAEEGAPAEVALATVVPNGIDLGYWRRVDRRLGEAVVFSGNLGYGPNADAARRLVRDVMPLVWAERPDTEVVVVGMGASPELAAALCGSRVTVTGAVADVRPHLERGAVFVAPLRIAAGIQNKLLEALSMEIPVVTTEVAAAGLRSAAGDPPVAVGTTDAELATATLALLRQAHAGHGRTDRDGRQWVADRFDWARSGAALAAVVDAACHREEASC